MPSPTATCLGLVIRSGPWQGRSNRDQLDIALAAAALGIELELFFIGEGVLQLLVGRQGGAADLPPGDKAWASLADLTPTRVSVEEERFRSIGQAGMSWLLAVEPLDAQGMLDRQNRCDRVLVL